MPALAWIVFSIYQLNKIQLPRTQSASSSRVEVTVSPVPLEVRESTFSFVKTVASSFCPSQNKPRSKHNGQVYYRLPENLNVLFSCLQFNSIFAKAFFFPATSDNDTST